VFHIRKFDEKKILFLHGWFSTGSSKRLFLDFLGHDVFSPKLSDWSFSDAVNQAQKSYKSFQPDLIVGSSRGGAVAMNIDSGNTPMVLLSPAWKKFGKSDKLEKNNVILIHSPNDRMVSPKNSAELMLNSVDGVSLYSGGENHRLNCKIGRMHLKKAINQLLD